MKNILHISDLHLSTNNKDGLHFSKCDNLINKLLTDSQIHLNKIEEKIDTIFFTGDLVYKGSSEEYEKLHIHFITPLLEKLELTTNDLYICPGNHDIDRSTINRFELKYRETSSLEEKNQLATDIQNKNETWARIQAFLTFQEKIDSNKKNIISHGPLHTTYKAGNDLYVLILNSAWLAQDNHEKGKLFITESQIKNAIKSTPPNAERILLIHHPLNWTNDQDSIAVSSHIEKKINVLMFGHMHEFNQSVEVKFAEDITLRLQAGTLDHSQLNPGYSIICLHNKNSTKYGKVIYRKLSTETGDYEAWNERGHNGEFDFSTDGSITFDSEKFSCLSAKILEKADKELLINTGLHDQQKKTVRELFVYPNLGEPNCIKAFTSIERIDSLENLKNFKGVAIVCGGNKQGKSFILQYIYASQLERQAQRDFSEIHFHLDAKKIDLTSKSKITQALCQEYIDQDLSTSFEKKIKQSISDGNATIIIDHFCSTSKSNQKTILDFIEENSNCKYIVSVSSNHELDTIKDFSDRKTLALGATSIGGLKRINIRQIVSKWAASITFDTEDKIFNDIMKIAKNSQLPHNHFIYSMLLAIYENKRELKGIINESDVIENFIEILLRKHFINTSSQLPQYKELLHFLGYTSKKMVTNKTLSINRNNLLKIALEFNEKTLFSYEVESYIEPLITSGILSIHNDLYSFSQICFFDFAVSYYMSRSTEFKEYILNEDNYLDFDKAVEYYASQNPSTSEILKFIKKKTDEAIQEIQTSIKAEQKIDIYTLDLNTKNNISFLDIASTSEQFEKKINEIKADKQQHDEMLDEISPLDTHTKQQKDFRSESTPKNKSDNITTLIANLSLYARIFRNTELTMDPAETLRFFDDITSGYIILTKANLARLDEDLIIPMLLPKIEEEFLADGVTQEEKENFIIQLRSFLSIIKGVIPNHVQSLMSDALSSRKPRLHNIVKKTLEHTTDEIKICLLIFLLIDIEHGDIKTHIKALLKHNGTFSKTTTFFKIMQILVSKHELSDDHRNYLSSSALQLVNNNKDDIGKKLHLFKQGIEKAIRSQ
jgi:predicted phosphodiesterase